MKFPVLVALIFTSAGAVSFFDLVLEQWIEFKLTYQKSYEDATEEKYRMKIFMENAHKIAKHNQLYEKGLASYTMKVNAWADMLHHEFVRTLNGLTVNLTGDQSERGGITYLSPANVRIPDEIDWRKDGAVTPVKDQGQCGSCWSFSATGSLEGANFRTTGKLVSLSEQNLVDCSGAYGNNGCSGGSMDNAFRYIIANGGLDTEASYPYEGMDGRCRYDATHSGVRITGYVDVSSGDEEALKSAVATVGPISVGIDASQDSFQFYHEGVYYEPYCSSSALDHGVLVVGYDTDETGQEYWLVKNSWGTSWGAQGYIKMARNRDNNCGIATMASYPQA